MSSPIIYLDNHATTRCDPRVVEAMLPYFTEQFGNANSPGHDFGAEAREAVAEARSCIATAIGAKPTEILFTSGATESNTLAIRGLALRKRRRGNHIVTSAIEHPSVLGAIDRLARFDIACTAVGVDQHGSNSAGVIDIDRVAESITDDTFLVSIMLANNEIGVIEPIAELAGICRERGVAVHCDATQAVGKIPVDVEELGIDLMSFTAHKLYGPKGIGALYVRSPPVGPRLEPIIAGGGQQQGRRAGTLNVPGIVGFAKAVALATESIDTEFPRLARLRNDLAAKLQQQIPGTEICGPSMGASKFDSGVQRLPHNLNLLVDGIDAASLVASLPGVAISTGAACSSDSPEPSHVLRALGLADDRILGSLRFGLGRFNTAAEIDTAAGAIADAVKKMRQMGG